MDDIPIWYLGSPYSHALQEVVARRYVQTCQAAARLFESGMHVYSPIAHTHAINEVGGLDAPTFEHWRAFDLGMLDRLHGLMVLTLPDWDRSTGLRAEIDHAHKIGKPMVYAAPRIDIRTGHIVDVTISRPGALMP